MDANNIMAENRELVIPNKLADELNFDSIASRHPYLKMKKLDWK